MFIKLLLCVFFFFKQKTAYEMRTSDWSSDVCSSDLCRSTGTCLSADKNSGTLPSGSMTRNSRTTADRKVMVAMVSVNAPPRYGWKASVGTGHAKIGRASCRERVCQYV